MHTGTCGRCFRSSAVQERIQIESSTRGQRDKDFLRFPIAQ